jgi:Ca-activated chloride channel family protein
MQKPKAILLLILLASTFRLAIAEILDHIPQGQWQLSHLEQDGKPVALLPITLYSYKNKIAIVEHSNNNCFQVFNPSDSIDTDIEMKCEQEKFDPDSIALKDQLLEIHSKEYRYVFKRSAAPDVTPANLTGVWRGINKQYQMIVRSNLRATFYQDKETMQETTHLRLDNHNLIFFSADGTFFPGILINNKIHFFGIKDMMFTKESTDLPSEFITDENGFPLIIDQLVASIKINGDLAETQLDIQFRTENDDDAEAKLQLPLSASATVTGYSLDIDGQMIPAVATPKEQARDALETLELRGIDPGIAEFTQNNQFQTEIYPIGKDRPRRISINFQERLSSAGKTLSYSLPLDKLGSFKHFSLNIEVSGKSPIQFESDSSINNKTISRYLSNRGNQFYRFRADSYSAKQPLEFQLIPTELTTQVNLIDGNQLFFRAPLKATLTPFTPEKLLVLWDNSFSMKASQEAYVNLLSAIAKQFPAADISVQPFSISFGNRIHISNSSSIDSQLSNLIYDGASNINLIKQFLESEKSSTILLMSDAIHSLGLLDLNTVSRPVYVIAPSNKQGNRPLLEGLAMKGNLAALTDFPRLNLRSFFVKLDEIEIPDQFKDVHISRRFNSDTPVELLGRIKKQQLPATISINVNNEKQNIVLSPDDSVSGQTIRFLWANAKLQPMLTNPKQFKDSITNLGKEFSIVTPYTSFIVLEDMDDYVEFGIKPPAVFDTDNEYDELREEFLADQTKEKSQNMDELFDAWNERLDWYKNPIKREKKSSANQSSGNDEIVVTGAHSSVDDVSSEDDELYELVAEDMGKFPDSTSFESLQRIASQIKVKSWAPDTPYMSEIRAVPLEKAYEIYLQQRDAYCSNLAFYMDVAKYFFDKGQTHTGYLILTNISEQVPEGILAQRMIAYTLFEYQKWALAQFYLDFINEIVPHEATSKRDLAFLFEQMATANPLLAKNAANYYWQAALMDDSYQHDLAITSIGELNHLISKWQLDANDITNFDSRFIAALEYDLRITLSWSNDLADVDLQVTEPNEERVFYSNRHGPTGSWLPFDNTSGFGPEEYLLKKSTKGLYKVKADFYSNNSVEAFGPVTVRVDFYRNYGRKNEVHKSATVRLEETEGEFDIAEIEID